MSSKKAILLVEDDQDDKDLFNLAISEIKDAPSVEMVSNGQEAIARLHGVSALPAMIFMDINMPVMDGIECLTEISKDPVIKGIPIVMLSSDAQQCEHTKKLGATGFIKKSSSMLELREEIERAISRFVTVDYSLT